MSVANAPAAKNPAIVALLADLPITVKKVEAFLAGKQFPLVHENTVTFVFHGRADRVALRHWIFGLQSSQAFTRVADSDPMRSPRRALSTEVICDTTTTLCLGRFPSPGSSRTFPGSLARCRLDVNAHTTTVVMREWLKTSS